MNARISDTDNALTADRIRVRRGGRTLLDAVSLSVHPGELLALLGPNGSGKSTLIRCLAAMLRPNDGRVTVRGDDVFRLPARELARLVAFVPQETSVAFGYTVSEFVQLGRPAASSEHLPLELAPLWNRSLLTLSGGERQRAAIVRALLQDTPFLLLDEPTAHLDLRHQADVLQILRRSAREQGKGILIVLHDLNLAALCDRILLLGDGKKIAEGTPTSVLTPAILQSVYKTELIIQANEKTGGIVVQLPDIGR